MVSLEHTQADCTCTLAGQALTHPYWGPRKREQCPGQNCTFQPGWPSGAPF